MEQVPRCPGDVLSRDVLSASSALAEQTPSLVKGVTTFTGGHPPLKLQQQTLCTGYKKKKISVSAHDVFTVWQLGFNSCLACWSFTRRVFAERK